MESWARQTGGFRRHTESCAKNCARHLVPGISAAIHERAEQLGDSWQKAGRVWAGPGRARGIDAGSLGLVLPASVLLITPAHTGSPPATELPRVPPLPFTSSCIILFSGDENLVPLTFLPQPLFSESVSFCWEPRNSYNTGINVKEL